MLKKFISLGWEVGTETNSRWRFPITAPLYLSCFLISSSLSSHKDRYLRFSKGDTSSSRHSSGTSLIKESIRGPSLTRIDLSYIILLLFPVADFKKLGMKKFLHITSVWLL